MGFLEKKQLQQKQQLHAIEGLQGLLELQRIR